MRRHSFNRVLFRHTFPSSPLLCTSAYFSFGENRHSYAVGLMRFNNKGWGEARV